MEELKQFYKAINALWQFVKNHQSLGDEQKFADDMEKCAAEFSGESFYLLGALLIAYQGYLYDRKSRKEKEV